MCLSDRSHASKLARIYGAKAVEQGVVSRFGGLLPNDAGLVPVLSESALRAIDTGELYSRPAAGAGGAARDDANVYHVVLTSEHEEMLRAALKRVNSGESVRLSETSSMETLSSVCSDLAMDPIPLTKADPETIRAGSSSSVGSGSGVGPPSYRPPHLRRASHSPDPPALFARCLRLNDRFACSGCAAPLGHA